MTPADFHTQLLILQGTPFCNIGCTYCYLSEADRRTHKVMPPPIAEQAARFLVDNGLVRDRLAVLWHAGEPLALKPGYYRECMERMAAVFGDDVQVDWTLQSNGVALDDAWCGLIRDQDIQIGISIDGPREIHDQYRRTKGGKGTFDLTMRGIRRLVDHGIPFSTLSVLTDASLGKAEELAAFFVDLDPVSIGINIEEIEGANATSSLERREDAVRSFIDAFHRALSDLGKLHLSREFRGLLQSIATLGSEEDPRGGENKALSIVTVAVDGSLSTFSPEICGSEVPEIGAFTFGTVSDSLDDVLCNPRYLRAHREIEAGVDACREKCRYFAFCGGGSPANKLTENGSFATTETLHCRLKVHAFTDAVVAGLRADRRANQAHAARQPFAGIRHHPVRIPEIHVDQPLFAASGLRSVVSETGICSFWHRDSPALYLASPARAAEVYDREKVARPRGSPGRDMEIDLAIPKASPAYREVHPKRIRPVMHDRRKMRTKMEGVESLVHLALGSGTEGDLDQVSMRLAYQVLWCMPEHLGFDPATVSEVLDEPRWQRWWHEFGGLVFRPQNPKWRQDAFVEDGIELAVQLLSGSVENLGSLSHESLTSTLFAIRGLDLPQDPSGVEALTKTAPGRKALFGLASRLVAGNASTAYLLNSVLLHLALDPELEAHVQAEALASGIGNRLEETHPLTTAVVLEALRYNAPIAILGVTVTDPYVATVDGVDVRLGAGTEIFYDIEVAARNDPRFPRPNRFDARANTLPLVPKGIARIVYDELGATFGSLGGKPCSGRVLAASVVVAMVVSVIRRYEVRVTSDRGPEELRETVAQNRRPTCNVAFEARRGGP